MRPILPIALGGIIILLALLMSSCSYTVLKSVDGVLESSSPAIDMADIAERLKPNGFEIQAQRHYKNPNSPEIIHIVDLENLSTNLRCNISSNEEDGRKSKISVSFYRVNGDLSSADQEIAKQILHELGTTDEPQR